MNICSTGLVSVFVFAKGNKLNAKMKHRWRRTISSMCVAAVTIIFCCAVAYYAVFFIITEKGRSGRGDIVIFIAIALPLICVTSFLCARRLKWTGEDSIVAISPLVFTLWPLCAWITQDGTSESLIRLIWLPRLVDEATLYYWCLASFLVAVPWFLGAFVANVVTRHK